MHKLKIVLRTLFLIPLLLPFAAYAQEPNLGKWYYFGETQAAQPQTTIGLHNSGFKPRPRLGQIDFIYNGGQNIAHTRLGSQKNPKSRKRTWTVVNNDSSVGFNLQNLRPESYLLATGASVRADAYIALKAFIPTLTAAPGADTKKVTVVFVDRANSAGTASQGNALIGLLLPDYAQSAGKETLGNMVKAALVIPKTGQLQGGGHLLVNNDDRPGGMKLAAFPAKTETPLDLYAVIMEINKPSSSPDNFQEITFKTFTLAKTMIESDPIKDWTPLGELTLTANGDKESEYTLFFSAEPKTYGIVAIRLN